MKPAWWFLEEDVPSGAFDAVEKMIKQLRIVCSTCGRHGRRKIELLGNVEVWCCMGPGDPCLQNQSQADERKFVDRISAYVAELKLNQLRGLDDDLDERALDLAGPVLE